MNTQQIYTDTICALQLGKTPRLKFSDYDLLSEDFLENLQLQYQAKKWDELKKNLCILDYYPYQHSLFFDFILEKLDFATPVDIMIPLLSLAQKYIIADALKENTPIPQKLDQKLMQLIPHKNAEIFMWAMRTVDYYGPQNRRFKTHFLSLRANPLRSFNPHYRESFKLIHAIMREWS